MPVLHHMREQEDRGVVGLRASLVTREIPAADCVPSVDLLFCSGQTGSGKTYTMNGKPQSCCCDSLGVVDRIFHTITDSNNTVCLGLCACACRAFGQR